MISKKFKNIAIIIARKGSIRIKNKNIKKFLGKPIIYYSIKILQKSKIFDEIFLSTNCDNIEKIAKKFGIKKIIRRSDQISNNSTGTIKVINHSIRYLIKKKITPKYVCCMYPASPLTNYKDIRSAFKMLKKYTKIGFLYPSTNLNFKKKLKYKNKFIKINKINKKLGIVNDYYLDAAQFYYASVKTWLKKKTVYLKNSNTFLVKYKTSDINTMTDWNNVKRLYLKYKIKI